MGFLIPCLPVLFLLYPPDFVLIQNGKTKKLGLYLRIKGLVLSPSVRSTGAGMKTGRMHSDKEEEEASLLEKRVTEEEEAGRRIRAASEGDTGDRMQSESEI